MSQSKENRGFQAEVKQLLQLMIHSLYSNKEIFLRELISNASDACDKLRFATIADADLYEGNSNLEIRITYDAAARTLTISDNGIGMNRDEVIANIGTIAKSGTKEFLAQLSSEQKQDANLIGQFGVGFYSSFIVADRVTLVTRRAGLRPNDGIRWESDGQGEYSIESVNVPLRGTTITLHLREGMDEFLSRWGITSIIKKYSDHISLPIILKKERWDEEKKTYVLTEEDETINQASALWTRPKSQITPEQYQELYKSLSHDSEAPLAWSHAKVEGNTEYTQLLYIPSHAPFDLWDREHKRGLKLYVRRIFIMDDAEQLLPNYLRFVRGVVDSSDLPLNVSREILQESKDIEAIRKGCINKILSILEDLAAQEPEKYQKFWNEFGPCFKEGLVEDFANRERIAKLCRFASTHQAHGDQIVALQDYLGRMKSGQEAIYYLTGDSYNAAATSPHLEIFRKKDLEVLLLSDRIDEWVVNSLPEFEGKKLQSISKGSLDLSAFASEDEKAAQEKESEAAQDLVKQLKTVLQEHVKEVKVTFRLTDSPACLVSDEQDMSSHLARLLKSAGQKIPTNKPILEINPQHPIIQRLPKENEANFAEWAHLLYEQALLAEGGQLGEPAQFVKRLNHLMLSLGAPLASS